VKNCQNKKSILDEISTFGEGILVIACLDVVAAEAAQSSLGSQDRAVELAFNHIFWKVIRHP